MCPSLSHEEPLSPPLKKKRNNCRLHDLLLFMPGAIHIPVFYHERFQRSKRAVKKKKKRQFFKIAYWVSFFFFYYVFFHTTLVSFKLLRKALSR